MAEVIVGELLLKIVENLKLITDDYEIILVDDFSAKIWKIINLKKNFGFVGLGWELVSSCNPCWTDQVQWRLDYCIDCIYKTIQCILAFTKALSVDIVLARE